MLCSLWTCSLSIQHCRSSAFFFFFFFSLFLFTHNWSTIANCDRLSLGQRVLRWAVVFWPSCLNIQSIVPRSKCGPLRSGLDQRADPYERSTAWSPRIDNFSMKEMDRLVFIRMSVIEYEKIEHFLNLWESRSEETQWWELRRTSVSEIAIDRQQEWIEWKSMKWKVRIDSDVNNARIYTFVRSFTDVYRLFCSAINSRWTFNEEDRKKRTSDSYARRCPMLSIDGLCLSVRIQNRQWVSSDPILPGWEESFCQWGVWSKRVTIVFGTYISKKILTDERLRKFQLRIIYRHRSTFLW